MKKTYWIIALLMFMLPCSMSAQVVIDNEDEDETELIDDEEGDEDDEDLIDEEDDEDDVISDEDILVVNDDEDGDGQEQDDLRHAERAFRVHSSSTPFKASFSNQCRLRNDSEHSSPALNIKSCAMA